MRRPVGCTIGVRPQRSLRRTHATTRPGLRHPTAPDHTRKSVYDKTGARHWATQEPRAAARGAARGAAGAPPGHGRAPLPSRACVSHGVKRRGDEVISARASATPRDSFRRDIEPAARGGVGAGARGTSGRAERHAARVEGRGDRVMTTSLLPRPEPLAPHPRHRPLYEPSVVSATTKVASRRREARKTSGAVRGCVCGELRAICRQQRAAFAEPPTLQAQLRHYPQLIPAGDDVSSHPG